MKIAIDMDNTIIDELGSTLRPGIIEALDYLSARHELILWSNSKRARVYEILTSLNIRNYFSKLIAREDYDPEERDVRKDIAIKNYDVLIDDDPKEIDFTNKNKRIGILVESYRKNKKMNPNELNEAIEKIGL